MRRALLSLSALALFATSAAAGGGINLSWSDCGPYGALSRNLSCNTTAGAQVMVGSGISPAPMSQLVALTAMVVLQTDESSLSPWWEFAPLGCRAGSLFAFFDYTAGPFSCADPWAGNAQGGFTFVQGLGAPNRAEIRVTCAVPAPVALDDVSEAYFFTLAFNNAHMTGAGICPGCTDGACFTLSSLLLSQAGGVGDLTLATPLLRNFVLWQGGGAGGLGTCSGATPTRATTWGAVKSLYR